MTVQELLNILNNKKEIPKPENAEICFYLLKENGDEVDLQINGIGAFDISTDVTISFKEF